MEEQSEMDFNGRQMKGRRKSKAIGGQMESPNPVDVGRLPFDQILVEGTPETDNKLHKETLCRN
jgi:hypothetical protein